MGLARYCWRLGVHTAALLNRVHRLNTCFTAISHTIPSKPGSGHGSAPPDVFRSLNPHLYDLSIVSSTPSSLTVSALLNITNPTPYEASIPYLSLHLLTNATILANASVRDLNITRGNNTALQALATWDPATLGGGAAALQTGIELLSQYISGRNTTLTAKLHAASIPSNPALSRALSGFNLTIPTPKLLPDEPGPPPDDPDAPDDTPRRRAPSFIDEAHFHLLSSTASFVLRSPLRDTELFVTGINATARYRGDAVGRIEYDLPFAVAPVDDEGNGSETPRLPVDWATGGAGWDAVRRALGGRLKIAAEAVVGIRVGEWTAEGIWFEGNGLGVSVGL